MSQRSIDGTDLRRAQAAFFNTQVAIAFLFDERELVLQPSSGDLAPSKDLLPFEIRDLLLLRPFELIVAENAQDVIELIWNLLPSYPRNQDFLAVKLDLFARF